MGFWDWITGNSNEGTWTGGGLAAGVDLPPLPKMLAGPIPLPSSTPVQAQSGIPPTAPLGGLPQPNYQNAAYGMPQGQIAGPGPSQQRLSQSYQSRIDPEYLAMLKEQITKKPMGIQDFMQQVEPYFPKAKKGWEDSPQLPVAMMLGQMGNAMMYPRQVRGQFMGQIPQVLMQTARLRQLSEEKEADRRAKLLSLYPTYAKGDDTDKRLAMMEYMGLIKGDQASQNLENRLAMQDYMLGRRLEGQQTLQSLRQQNAPGAKPQWRQGVDAQGNVVWGWANPADQTFTPFTGPKARTLPQQAQDEAAKFQIDMLERLNRKRGGGAAQANKGWMSQMPDAASNKGRRLQADDGKFYISDGQSWIPQ